MFKIENEITKVSKYKTLKNKNKKLGRLQKEPNETSTIANPIVKK